MWRQSWALAKLENAPIKQKERADVCDEVKLRLDQMTTQWTFGLLVVSETGLGEWPLPFLVVKESVVALKMT